MFAFVECPRESDEGRVGIERRFELVHDSVHAVRHIPRRGCPQLGGGEGEAGVLGKPRYSHRRFREQALAAGRGIAAVGVVVVLGVCRRLVCGDAGGVGVAVPRAARVGAGDVSDARAPRVFAEQSAKRAHHSVCDRGFLCGIAVDGEDSRFVVLGVEIAEQFAFGDDFRHGFVDGEPRKLHPVKHDRGVLVQGGHLGHDVVLSGGDAEGGVDVECDVGVGEGSDAPCQHEVTGEAHRQTRDEHKCRDKSDFLFRVKVRPRADRPPAGDCDGLGNFLENPVSA